MLRSGVRSPPPPPGPAEKSAGLPLFTPHFAGAVPLQNIGCPSPSLLAFRFPRRADHHGGVNVQDVQGFTIHISWGLQTDPLNDIKKDARADDQSHGIPMPLLQVHIQHAQEWPYERTVDAHMKRLQKSPAGVLTSPAFIHALPEWPCHRRFENRLSLLDRRGGLPRKAHRCQLPGAAASLHFSGSGTGSSVLDPATGLFPTSPRGPIQAQ